MVKKSIVQKALKKTSEMESRNGRRHHRIAMSQDSLISRLIYDVFGGEILKTHFKRDWHFYNRINGKRFDFTYSADKKSAKVVTFEDIAVTPSETSDYFDRADYLTFLMRFVKSFEEVVGLPKYERNISI